MRKFKVAFMGELPAHGYSGGRYHAWIMAEALAEQNNHVYFVTNNIPEFSKDFESYPAHGKINIVLTNDFYDFEFQEESLDYVICVPAIAAGKKFYQACMDFSIRKGARFVFINFETPNWYQLYAKMERPLSDYEILRDICKYGCLVLSSAKESQKYAKTFYDKYPKKTEFSVWSPPINTIVADNVREDKQDQILVFLRIKDKHKGGDDFLKLLGDYLRGMTCVCIVGTGEIDPEFLQEAEEKAKEHGIKLRYEKSLSDLRKFQEIKRSRLLLFPSHFEGYGYPPVEALYCGTKCIAYDLPVLKEVSGEFLTYSEIDNIEMMRTQAEALLQKEEIEPICVDTADFFEQSKRLQTILEENYDSIKLKVSKKEWHIMMGKIRKWYYTKLVPDIIKYCIDNHIVISDRFSEDSQNWNWVKKQIKDKKVYIWGCGKAYRELYPKYKNRIKIVGVLDGNPEKIGTLDRVSGKFYIQSPLELKKMDASNIAIFISNKEHVDEIANELDSMGVKSYYSLCLIACNSLSAKIYKMIRKRI